MRSRGCKQTEYLLLSAAFRYLNPVRAALFIAALASALMGTSDSSVLAGASVFTQNVLPFFKKSMTDKDNLRWTRFAVVASGLISVAIALLAGTIYRQAMVAWSLLLVGLFAPFAFGMYWKKANSSGANAAFIGGFVVWILATIFFFNSGLGGQSTAVVCEYTPDMGAFSDGWWCAFWDAVYIGSFTAFLSAILLMVVVSLVTQKKDPARKLVDYYGEPIDMNPRLHRGNLPIKDAFRKISAEEKDVT